MTLVVWWFQRKPRTTRGFFWKGVGVDIGVRKKIWGKKHMSWGENSDEAKGKEPKSSWLEVKKREHNVQRDSSGKKEGC